MNNDKMVRLIERELVQADEAQTEAEFEKHMYAIHTLTSLYTISDTQSSFQSDLQTSKDYMSSTNVRQSNQFKTNKDDVSLAEIKAMGGKVPPSMNKKPMSQTNVMTTDDNIGNGDSIFDF